MPLANLYLLILSSCALNSFLLWITYKVDATGKDEFYLSNNEDCSNALDLDITGKRLIIEKNSNDNDNTINISRWSNE